MREIFEMFLNKENDDMPPVSPPGRNLTDEDVKAIVKQLKSELVTDFYGEVGRGVWAWVRKIIMWILLSLAIYGVANEAGIVQQHVVKP